MAHPNGIADHLAQLNRAKLADSGTLNKLDKLIEALLATEGNKTKNTEEYDAFSAGVRDPKNLLAGHENSLLTNQGVSETLTRVASLAGNYIEVHKDIEDLSSRQEKRMDLARQFRDVSMSVNDRLASEYTMEEIEAATVWYESFKEVLAAQGIDFDNPYALGRVCIMHDTNLDIEKDPNDLSNEEYQRQFAEGRKLYSYAFMDQRSDGAYVTPRTKNGADLRWIRDNMQKPGSLSDADIMRLYRSAKDCRLYLRLPIACPEEKAETPQTFYVDTEGKARITPPGTGLFRNMNDQIAIDYHDIAMSDEAYAKLVANDDRRQMVGHVLEGYDVRLKQEGSFENKEDFLEYNSRLNAEIIEKDLLVHLSATPSWAENDAKIDYQERAASLANVPKHYLPDDAVEVLKDNSTFTDDYYYLLRSIEKRQGTRNIDALMKSGKILRTDKTPFSTEDSFKFIDEVFNASRDGEGVYMEYQKDGVTKSGYYVMYDDAGFSPAIKAKDLDLRTKQMRQAVAELRKEDSSPELEEIEKYLSTQISTLSEGYNGKRTPFVGDNFFAHNARRVDDEYVKYLNAISKDAPLTPTQIRTLTVLADLRIYHMSAVVNTDAPNADVKERIATAMVCSQAAELLKSAKAEDVEKGRQLLTDHAVRKQAAVDMMASEDFKAMTDGKIASELEDIRASVSKDILHVGVFEKDMELEDAKVFLSGLDEQLKARGYDTPLALAQVCVRNDSVTAKQVTDAVNNYDFEGIKEGYRLIDEAQQFAFVERDADGKPLSDRRDLESRLAWIRRTTKPVGEISDEQAIWIYRAAKEGRLVLKPDSTGANIDPPSYILVGFTGKPLMGKTLEDLKKNPGEYGFTRKRMEEIEVSEEEKGSMEISSRMILGGAGLHYRKAVNNAKNEAEEIAAQQALDAFSRIEGDCFEEIYLRDVTAMAHSHRTWFNDPKDAKLITKVIGLGSKDQDNLTPEDRKLMAEYPAISEDGTLLEKGLLKRSGCKTIEEVRASGKVTDRKGKPFTAGSDFKFVNDVMKKCAEGEIFVDGKPYRMVPSFGFDKSVDVAGYAAEAKYLGDLFKKAGVKAAGAGDDYAFLSKLMTELPGKIKGIDLYGGDPQTELQKALIEATAVGDAYIRGLQGDLTGPQLRTIKAINRLRDLRDKAIAGEVFPEKGSADKLAEKIATAYAIKNRTTDKARDYMTNPAKRKIVINALKETPTFKQMLKECEKAGLDKVMKISGEKLCAQYEKNDPTLAHRNNQPQNEQRNPILG